LLAGLEFGGALFGLAIHHMTRISITWHITWHY
jgi:hypothetical protein